MGMLNRLGDAGNLAVILKTYEVRLFSALIPAHLTVLETMFDRKNTKFDPSLKTEDVVTENINSRMLHALNHRAESLGWYHAND